MSRVHWRGHELDLGEGAEPDADPLGPDERDRDLLDGSWEERQREKRRQSNRRRSEPSGWQVLGTLLAVIALASLIVPLVLSVLP